MPCIYDDARVASSYETAHRKAAAVLGFTFKTLLLQSSPALLSPQQLRPNGAKQMCNSRRARLRMCGPPAQTAPGAASPCGWTRLQTSGVRLTFYRSAVSLTPNVKQSDVAPVPETCSSSCRTRCHDGDTTAVVAPAVVSSPETSKGHQNAAWSNRRRNGGPGSASGFSL